MTHIALATHVTHVPYSARQLFFCNLIIFVIKSVSNTMKLKSYLQLSFVPQENLMFLGNKWSVLTKKFCMKICNKSSCEAMSGTLTTHHQPFTTTTALSLRLKQDVMNLRGRYFQHPRLSTQLFRKAEIPKPRSSLPKILQYNTYIKPLSHCNRTQ